MKASLKTISLFASAALLTFTSLSAVETVPVGYITINTPDGDDSLFGLSLTQPTAYTGVASSPLGAQFSISGSDTLDVVDTHYVLATSGSNAGQWSQVFNSGSGALTTAEVLLADGDTFSVIPFWTLSTVFPNGEGVGASSDPFNPSQTILLNDLTATGINLSSEGSYFYFAGPSPEAGWYKSGSFEVSNDVPLTPDTYITLRNNSGSLIRTVIAGAVPVKVIGTQVVGLLSNDQDNQVTNPYPSAMTLATSGLQSVVAPAADPFNPVDTVLLYDPEATSGQNISAAAAYFYFAGPSPAAGWYQTGSFAASNDVEIPAGGALIIRKGAGDDEVIAWNPPVPYSNL